MGRVSTKLVLTCLVTVALVGLGACDLFVSDEARIQKASQLRTLGDYSAAVIELKKVLQKHPNNRDARLLLGEISLLKGEPAAAEKEFRRALELGTTTGSVIVPLGQALLDQGQFESALQELDASATRDDDMKTRVLMLRGEAYLAMNKLVEAEHAFREVLALREGSLDARTGLARVAVGRNDLGAADAYIAGALSMDTSYVRGWLAKGQLDLLRGRYAQAEEAFLRVVQQSPVPAAEELIARNGLAECQWRQGKSDLALQNVERMMQLAPQHPRPKYLRALIAYGAGDYATARDQLQQVLRGFPDNRPAALLLGATHYAQGELEQADMYLSSILAADPSSLSARKLLAATRLRQHKPQEAIATLTPVLTRDRNDSQLLALMGRASLEAGASDTGLAYLQRSAQNEPSNQALQMQLAVGYVSAGEFEHAIRLLESMPPPKDGKYGRDVLLVLAYLRKGDNEGAVAQVQRLIASRPDEPGVHNLAGTVYGAAGQLARAREEFDTALRLQPDNLAVLMNMGRLDFREGKFDSARARFERVLASSPKNSAALIALAQLSQSRGDQAAAGQWLERAAEADPQALEPRLLLVRHYLETGDLTRARAIADKAAEAAPSDGKAQNALGIVQMAERKYEEAATSFAKSVTAAPDTASFAYNLARAELARDNLREAKKALNKSLELQADYVPATEMLAELEMREGNSAQALGRARGLQQDKDTAAAGYSLEGDLYMMRREYASAARAYDATSKHGSSGILAIKAYHARNRAQMPDATKPLEQWLSKHPNDIPVRLVLAESHQERRQLEQAAAQYERILKDQPNSPGSLNNLAWIYHQMKDPRAVATAERAYQLRPDNGDIADTLGWLLVQEGEVQRGVDLLRKAVEQAPSVPDIRYHLAVGLDRLGAKEEARRTLVELVNSGQTFEDLDKAKHLLQQL